MRPLALSPLATDTDAGAVRVRVSGVARRRVGAGVWEPPAGAQQKKWKWLGARQALGLRSCGAGVWGVWGVEGPGPTQSSHSRPQQVSQTRSPPPARGRPPPAAPAVYPAVYPHQTTDHHRPNNATESREPRAPPSSESTPEHPDALARVASYRQYSTLSWSVGS